MKNKTGWHIIYNIILCIMLVAPFPMHAQESATRSRYSKITDKNQIAILLDSAEQYLISSPQMTFDYVEKALQLSITAKDHNNEARSYFMLGKVNAALQQYDLAIRYFNEALKLYTELNSDQLYELQYHLAQAYEKHGNLNESIDYYKLFLNYVVKKKLTDKEIQVRYDLASVYTTNNEYNKALKEYNDIQKLEESRDNKKGLADVNTLRGEFYLKQKKSDEAIKNYQQAVALAEESEDIEMQSRSLRNLGNAYRSNKQFNEELQVRQQALDLSKELNENEALVEDNLMIGEAFIEQKKPDEAVKYIQKSIEISDKIGDIEKKGDGLRTLSEAYKYQGDYDKALIAYQEYTAIMDSVTSRRERELRNNLKIVANINRKLQRIDLLERDMEVSQKTVALLQKEQELNIKELKTQKRITYSLILVIIVLSVASFYVYKSGIQKRKANLLLTLRSLRSQMNPHFIFNSLNSVNSYIAQNNERMANKYLAEFAHLMRLVLENSKTDFVSVSSELDIINLYLKLEHSRFQDKFDYQLEIDPEINQSESQIPPMLIQPYIENAIWHGLRYKEQKGLLKVILKKENQSIVATITDNGVGREKSQELKTKHQKTGSSTGLKNIKNRLDIINEIYKTSYRVIIDDLNKEELTGTIVRIYIPLLDDNRNTH